MVLYQVDCFERNLKFLKFLSIWPDDNPTRCYKYCSKTFITIFVFLFYILFTINFFFLPRSMDIFINDMMFFFTDCSVLSKVMTFLLMREKINKILDILESDIFQPEDPEEKDIVKRAKDFNKLYWKIVAYISNISNYTNFLPFILHFVKGTELRFPVCAYSFLTDPLKSMLIYPLYIYQALGITFHMLYNVNVDTFFLGLMVLTIAQLEVLDVRLRKVTDVNKLDGGVNETSNESIDRNKVAVIKINKCIIHFDEVNRFRSLVEDVFSVTLFVQFSMASCVICVCLMRFTMPAPLDYLFFLGTYMIAMILQIIVPCWFGSKIMDKSRQLAFSVYNCDWTTTSRQFKSNMRLFVERTNKPLTITGGKMFCLSLSAFTSIINSAYSFFTLLQQMQD
uniref:Odorant receptor n=1 Tax=Athetis lepigone TaxID=1223490 RepID=A0A1B3B754_ATHLE|nr:putative odorant receptor OR18 [Athetis lepigone]